MARRKKNINTNNLNSTTMATKSKSQLKDVFNGPSSLLYMSNPLTITESEGVKTFSNVTPELDVPCKVDSLEFEQGEAEIQEYNVIGLNGAWVSDNEPGDINLSFRVPSIHEDVLKLAFGEDAVASISGAVESVEYEGLALTLKDKKVEGTWMIMNKAKNRLMILNNTALYASLKLDQDVKGVAAVDFNGTLESDGTNPDVIFLKKKAS